MARVTVLTASGEPSLQLARHQSCKSMSCPVWGLSGCAPGDVTPERRVGERRSGPQEQLSGQSTGHRTGKGAGDGREQSSLTPAVSGRALMGAGRGRSILPLRTRWATAMAQTEA